MIQPEVRAIIAAAAIAHATGRNLSSIYDYSGAGYRSISMQIAGTKVTGYDYSISAHFSGSMPSLYHYGVSGHVEFKHKGGNKYGGYDYSSGSHFEVTVKGNDASFYDYGSSGWTSYSA